MNLRRNPPFDRTDPRALLAEPDPARRHAGIRRLAQESRIDVLDLLHAKGTGHWGGAASAAELLAYLYFAAMRVRPEEPAWPDRDRLVVGKGHASAMLYTLLAKRGYFPLAEVFDTFRQLDSRMQGHPCMNKTPGVEMSTGALGHGLSVGLGMALAARLQRRNYWTYVLVGDGCLNEGQTWEAAMAAAKFRPERLVLLVDYNRVQLDGPADEIMPLEPLADKLRAFGWNVAPTAPDGHDVAAIATSFDWLRAQSRWPVAIVYATHKGHGVSFMSDNSQWHGAVVDDNAYSRARPELLAALQPPASTP
ncbi:MAG: transketolase [Verrucomicrobia bacterium]|nr:transketolase [Verrucomicrobiota bacterium]